MLLETDRFILRPIRPTDFDELFRMNSDPVVMKYIGDGSIRTPGQMLNELEMLISYYKKKPGMGVWAIELKISSGFIGAGGLTYNTNKVEVELGYRLLREHWNKGYATEVANGLLKYAFQNLKVSKVIASAHIENNLSQNVLRKIGMEHIGDGVEFNCPQAYYEISTGDYL